MKQGTAELLDHNVQLQSKEMLRALGSPIIETEVLTVSAEPAIVLRDEDKSLESMTQSVQSNQCQQSQQSQQSYSSFSSQNSTRCSHGCHGPR